MRNAASDSRPWQLRALVAVALCQAVLMLIYVVLDVVLAGTATDANWGAVAFLVTLLGIWGVGLAFSARALWRRQRWGFTPVVFTQLMFGLLAVEFIPPSVAVAKVVWLVILASAIAALLFAFSRPVRAGVAGTH